MLGIHLAVNTDCTIGLGFRTPGRKRQDKGKSLLCVPDRYVIVDIETTGLDPDCCEIIELGALKVDYGKVTDEYASLIKPSEPIDSFISKLTGITNEMLSDAPRIETALPEFMNFVGDETVIGHNVNFDINFIYDKSELILNKPFRNDFVDTMRLARHSLPGLPNHKLSTLAEHFCISSTTSHRALDDCITTFQIVGHLPKTVDIQKRNLSAKDVTTEKTTFDINHILYGKTCVFTGALEKMTRKEAMQIVVDFGGFCGDNVTAKTNYLILGNNDFCSAIKDGKSSKQKKAEKLILEGKDLQIISENVFYDLIESE